MKLRPSLSMVLAAAFLVAGSLAAQEPQPIPIAVTPDQQEPQVEPPQGGLQTRPPTEAEEREKRIRQLDPRAPRTPDAPRVPPVPGDDPNAPAIGNAASQTKRDAPQPLPGSVAASNRQDPRALGPKVADNDDAANDSSDRYTGPAVLTRSYTLQTPQLAQDIRWRYTLGFNEVYDSSSAALATPGTSASRFGQQYTWGFSGRHVWKKDSLSLNYSGAWNAYSAPSLRGSNHSLSLNYSRVLSRRLTFNLVTAASVLTQGASLEDPITSPTNSLANVNIAASPIVQLFDSTTKQVNFTPSLQWQKSARLSFTVSGSWFGVDREGLGLVGQTGYQAQADVNYRLTRRITTGAYYSYTSYRYSHDIAVTDSHGAGLIFSTSFDRSTQLRLRGGLSFFENDGLTLVQIDPFLASLLGTKVGIIDQYNSNVFTEMSGELARDLRHNRTATLSYSRGLAPGNGLILASVQQSAAAGINFRLRRQYLVGTGVGWTALSSQAETATGNYSTEYVYLSISRPTGRRATSLMRFDYRKFSITTAGAVPNQLRISLGVNWNSGDGPLRLW